MKRIVCIILTCILYFSLTGCTKTYKGTDELIEKPEKKSQLCAQQRAINLTGAKPVCLRSNQSAVASLAW